MRSICQADRSRQGYARHGDLCLSYRGSHYKLTMWGFTPWAERLAGQPKLFMKPKSIPEPRCLPKPLILHGAILAASQQEKLLGN